MFKYKKYVIIILLIWCLALFMPDTVFANANINQEPPAFVDLLNMLLNIFSWLWMLLATIAGKFMTNAFIYNSTYFSEATLFKMRQWVRTFVNFFIWFLFIFLIFKSFWSWDSTTGLKKQLPMLLLTAILTQMTWFLMWALIDVSNIATVAVWSLPSQVIEDNQKYQDFIQDETVKMPKTVQIDLSNNVSQEKIVQSSWDSNVSISDVMDNITQDFNDLTGPLMFLGYSILEINKITIDPWTWKDEVKSVIISFLFGFLISLMFIVPLLMLAIVNIIRVWYIWMWIVFSPVVVLLSLLGKELWWWWKSLDKLFNVKTVLWLIFVPVTVVAALSLCLILAISIKAGLTEWSNDDKFDMWGGVVIEDNYKDAGGSGFSKITTPTWEMTMIGSILETWWKWIWYIIISLFTCFLLWTVVKVSFMTSDIAQKITDPIFKSMENIWTSSEIVPWVSVAGIKNIPDSVSRISSAKMTDSMSSVDDKIAKMFDVWNNDISMKELWQLKKFTHWDHKWAKDYFDRLRKAVTSKEGDINIDISKNLQTSIKYWLTTWWWIEYLKTYAKFTDDATKELLDKKDATWLLKNKEFLSWLHIVMKNPEVNFQESASSQFASQRSNLNKAGNESNLRDDSLK